MNRLHRPTVRAALFSLFFCALLALNSTRHPAQQSAATAQTPSARPQDDSILLTVTVTDKNGGYIKGLTQGSFAVYEDKAPREVTFFTDRDEPLSIGIVFDSSASMGPSSIDKSINPAIKIKPAANALARFMQLGNSSNLYFLVGFSRRAELLSDWTRSAGMLETISTLQPKGNTALYDACYMSLRKIMENPRPKRALLLITDGLENSSKHKLGELRRLVKQSGVLIYTVKLPSLVGFIDSEDRRGSLDTLAKDSGGQVFAPENERQFGEALELLAFELHHQYLIGFKPSAPAGDKKLHQLRVTVTTPASTIDVRQLSLRHREGYYTAKEPR